MPDRTARQAPNLPTLLKEARIRIFRITVKIDAKSITQQIAVKKAHFVMHCEVIVHSFMSVFCNNSLLKDSAQRKC